MTMAFALALVAGTLLKFWLASRQIRHVAQHREAVPEKFASTVTLAAHQKAADYTISKTRFGLLELALGTAVLLGWTLLGGLDTLNGFLLGVIGPGMGQQIALLVAFALVGGLIDLPLAWYQTFLIEERFGFNKMSLRLWMLDLLKSSLVGAVIGVPIAALILWLMGAAAIAVPTALGIFGPGEVAFADGKLSFGTNAKKPTAKVSTAVATEPPRLLPVPDAKSAVIQTVSDSQSVAATGSGQKSEVMKQLELLYEKDGREMPDLQTIQPVPNGGTPAAAPATSGKSAPAGAQPLRTQLPMSKSGSSNSAGASGLRATPSTTVAKPNSPATTPQPSKNPVTSFFRKLIPGNKEPKPTAAGPNYQPNVAPSPPNVPAGPARHPEYQPAQIRTGQSPAQSAFATNPAAQRPAAPSLSQQPDLLNSRSTPALTNVPTQPALSFGGLPPSPSGDFGAKLGGADNTGSASLPPLLSQPQSTLPESPAAVPRADELPLPKPTGSSSPDSPFTEMSEDEADGEDKAGPFTGLTLDEEAKGPAESAKKTASSQEAAASNDPFADELRKLGILPPLEQGAKSEEDAPKLALPTLDLLSLDGIEDEVTREKMLKIRERGGMKGLKGFCPITLHDDRELVDAKPDYHATYRGQKFHFASADAKSKFEEDPSLYAPAAYGADVVALTRDKDVVEGSLDHAAWFKGRLYLFGSQDAHDAFVASPVQFATPAGIE